MDIALRKSGECGITGDPSITIKSILLNTSFLINRIGFMSLIFYGGGRGGRLSYHLRQWCPKMQENYTISLKEQSTNIA